MIHGVDGIVFSTPASCWDLLGEGVVSGIGLRKLEKLDMQFDGKGREVKNNSVRMFIVL